VNKNQISRVPLIASPCCSAPSTTMNPISSDRRSNERKCVRCRGVFCRIDIRGKGAMRPALGINAKEAV
jgi:hypothetical protein